MDPKDKSLLARIGNAALVALVVISVLNLLLTKRLGGFILLTLIAGFGSFMLVCGAINMVAWNFFDYYGLEPESWWWIHLFCWGGSALFSAVYMAYYGLWESVDKKCKKIDREVGRIH